MVDVLTQHARVQDEMEQALIEVLRSGAYINGPAVQSFRQHLGQYLDVPQVISCANGTDALQVALMALDLKPGEEVITPSFTYIATVEVIALLGLKPVFVEVDPATFNIDPAHIERAITSKTRVILPVHLYGQPADMEPILALAQAHNLYVVEDNAQAIGAEYTFENGLTRKTGTIGDIGCISFYPSKNLGACGDGGAIATRDEALGKKLWTVCNHGQEVRYYHDMVGVNSRLDSMQAALLDIKLKHLDAYNQARILAADRYDRLLGEEEGLILPVRAAYGKHVFHQYTLKVKAGRAARDAMQTYLQSQGIPTMIYYPVASHLQKAYQGYGYQEGDLPVSEQLTAEVISLPMHSELTEEQQVYITDHVKKALEKVYV